jgi:hypothetical protein
MSPEARDHSFDELTRGLASGNLSRGKALKLMGAALLGGTLASIPGLAWAKPRPDGAKCKRNKHCASGQCVNGVCGGGACAGCTEPCECATDARTGEQVCVQQPFTAETDCNACLRGEVCVASSNPGEVGCVAPCPITACAGCPEPCVCVEDLENPGVQACVQPIARIEANCDACPSELPVCHGDPTVGEVGCSAPCP